METPVSEARRLTRADIRWLAAFWVIRRDNRLDPAERLVEPRISFDCCVQWLPVDDFVASLNDPADLLGGINLVVPGVNFLRLFKVVPCLIFLSGDDAVARPGHAGPLHAAGMIKQQASDHDELRLSTHLDPCPTERFSL